MQHTYPSIPGRQATFVICSKTPWSISSRSFRVTNRRAGTRMPCLNVVGISQTVSVSLWRAVRLIVLFWKQLQEFLFGERFDAELFGFFVLGPGLFPNDDIIRVRRDAPCGVPAEF